jgi:hypothetical protein
MDAEFHSGWPTIVTRRAAARSAWTLASYGQAACLAVLHQEHGWPIIFGAQVQRHLPHAVRADIAVFRNALQAAS